MPKNGDVLRTTFENFEIVSQISGGGAGEVYRANDSSGKPVAIKVLRFDPDSTKRKRFEREIKFCSAEVHPNIIRVLGHGVYLDNSKERPFYVMPLYEGTLEDYLSKGPSEDDKLRVFAKILDGIEAAHILNITHRDIKPKNILIGKNGSEVAVADFGIARFLEEQIQQEAALTKPGDRLANFEYAAPEQLTPGQEADERTDIFMLGLLLHRIYTGSVPRGTGYVQISSVAPSLPYLDEIANFMIQQDRNNRPRSIDEVKRLFIQRRIDFVERQKLDKLKVRVIPATEVSVDPLIEEPIRIIDKTWRDGELVLYLSQTPNNAWTRTLTNGRFGASGIGSASPDRVKFTGAEARIPIAENVLNDYMLTTAYKYAQQWVAATNVQYANDVAAQRAKARADEEQQRRNLQEEFRRAEEALKAQARALEILARIPN